MTFFHPDVGDFSWQQTLTKKAVAPGAAVNLRGGVQKEWSNHADSAAAKFTITNITRAQNTLQCSSRVPSAWVLSALLYLALEVTHLLSGSPPDRWLLVPAFGTDAGG